MNNTVYKLQLNTLNDFTIEINGKKIYTEYSGYFSSMESLESFLQNMKIVSRKSYSRTPKGKLVSKIEDPENHSYKWFIQNLLDTFQVFKDGSSAKISNELPWRVEFSQELIAQ